MDNVDEQIDTVSRSVLALTASCARCHDHKFDPIPTTDYYALAGIFQQHRPLRRPAEQDGRRRPGLLRHRDARCTLGAEAQPDPEPAEKIEQAKKAYEAAKKEFEAIRGTPEGHGQRRRTASRSSGRSG